MRTNNKPGLGVEAFTNAMKFSAPAKYAKPTKNVQDTIDGQDFEIR